MCDNSFIMKRLRYHLIWTSQPTTSLSSSSVICDVQTHAHGCAAHSQTMLLFEWCCSQASQNSSCVPQATMFTLIGIHIVNFHFFQTHELQLEHTKEEEEQELYFQQQSKKLKRQIKLVFSLFSFLRRNIKKIPTFFSTSQLTR